MQPWRGVFIALMFSLWPVFICSPAASELKYLVLFILYCTVYAFVDCIQFTVLFLNVWHWIVTVALPELSAAKTVAAVTQELELLADREGAPVVVCMWNWLGAKCSNWLKVCLLCLNERIQAWKVKSLKWSWSFTIQYEESAELL